MEQSSQAVFEPASKPYWTAIRVVALILIVLAAVSSTGVVLYYGRPPVNVANNITTCSNGASNPPSCTTYAPCSNGALNPPSCDAYANCLNGASNPPSCTTFPPCSDGALNPPSCTNCPGGQSLVGIACIVPCSNGATNPPSCNDVCTNGATNFPGCNQCSNGSLNPPYCNDHSGPFCLAFNFGRAEYSQNNTGWYIILYVQNQCSDRNLIASRVSVDGTIFSGPWTALPPVSTSAIVVCMSCAGLVFIPCRIYMITIWVTGTGTSSGDTSQQGQGFGWQCT